jgi:hypothetical protein
VTSNALVVTGSRIRSPSLDRNEMAASRALAADESSAPEWVLKDPAYAIFLKRLQTAIRTNDRGAVIKLVGLPLRVNFDRPRLYPDGKSVLADYDRIFTPNVRKAILAQRFEKLFGRDQGVMIGSGEVWFDHVCLSGDCSRVGPVRIKAINVL